MIIILQLIALGLFALIVVNIWQTLRGRNGALGGGVGATIDGEATPAGPAEAAAASLRAFETARSSLRSAYPALFAMLGGYLNAHTVVEHGGPEGAVAEMIKDWSARRDEISREITRVLADAETEEAARAGVLAACDADFEAEGYRPWLTWLLGQFNKPL